MGCPVYAQCSGCIYCDPPPHGYGMTQDSVGEEDQRDPPSELELTDEELISFELEEDL